MNKKTIEISNVFDVYDLARLLEKTLEEKIKEAESGGSCLTWGCPGSLYERAVELRDACSAYIVERDFDPTPDSLWDDYGGEPPLTANERHSAAWREHLEAHG